MVALAGASSGNPTRCATPRWKDEGIPKDKRLESVLANKLLELSNKQYPVSSTDESTGAEQLALQRCSVKLTQPDAFRLPASSLKIECRSRRSFDDWLGDCRRGLGAGYKPEDLQACGFVDGVYWMDLVYATHRLREALGAVDVPQKAWRASCSSIN
jgi:hypothetical protein